VEYTRRLEACKSGAKTYHVDIEGKIPFMGTHLLLGWKCGPAIKLTLHQVLVQNYQFRQSDEDSRCRLENKQESSNVQEF
jgi:hypothetical protein